MSKRERETKTSTKMHICAYVNISVRMLDTLHTQTAPILMIIIQLCARARAAHVQHDDDDDAALGKVMVMVERCGCAWRIFTRYSLSLSRILGLPLSISADCWPAILMH